MATEHAPTIAEADDEVPQLVGLTGEFADVSGVVAAAEKVRDAGYTVWDVHSPFPIHGIDKAMGLKPTILPWLVLGAGITGLLGGLGMVWFTNAFDYKFLISGKPIFSLPANIPVLFECTVLFAALTAVFGMLGLNKLPMLYNPLLKSARFRRVTDDRFFVVIDAADPKFKETEVANLLLSLGAVAIERVED